ncbi:MAG: hypothetical protein IT349_04930 [Candidatus Eisenbacteria bacterium]|nr:hypothetical protein [Candidatus Eisenbacteria bacterium]MCC7141427.1 hypothetical protein [Candidatus Eisenbacteria bacterium]
MHRILKARLEQSFDLTYDLAAHLEEPALGLDLPGLPSNRMAGQLWCVVGARESYIAALRAGRWTGFSCSLESPRVKSSVLAALAASRALLDQVDLLTLDAARTELAFALLEHEIQHHGQLVRYVYANRLSFPPTWNQRYTV